MNQIWKFPLEITDIETIMMPIGARILCVQVQKEFPFLWALVNPDAKKEARCFRTVGTGHLLETMTDKYIGTYQIRGGSLVFHVFEVAP